MRTYYIACLLLLSACGKAPNIDPAFAEYVYQFSSTYSARVEVDVVFADLDAKTAGECQMGKVVRISRSFWQGISDAGRMQLVYHELGHCVLLLQHTSDSIIKDGMHIPKSIMYPVFFGSSLAWHNNVRYYEEELKSE